jgi:hypothetical protein
MLTRVLLLVLVAIAMMFTVRPVLAPAAELKPLEEDWERFFWVTWEPARHHGLPVVAGYVKNTSPRIESARRSPAH